MDTPLINWYCDVCGQKITDPDSGYVIWHTSTNPIKFHGFKIIHQNKCDDNTCPSSAALSDFLGEAGLTYLLTFLSQGQIIKLMGQNTYPLIDEFDEFVDFFRRVQVPYYEEARRCFSNPDLLDDFSGNNETAPYLPESLKDIIKTYGNLDR